MSLENSLKSYLKQLSSLRSNQKMPEGWRYSSLEQLVLVEGSVFTEYVTVTNHDKMKDCFRNAFLRATSDRSLTYVEGYFMTDRLPLAIHHAWCVQSDGKVLDTTIRFKPDEQACYMGIPFDTDKMINAVMNEFDGYAGMFTPKGGFTNVELMKHGQKAYA